MSSINPTALRPSPFVPLVFIASIPITSFLTAPGGIAETLVNGTINALFFRTVAPAGKLAALSTLYFIGTYVFAAAGSVSGLASGHKDGRSNAQPRAHISELTGLPLRLYSAHVHMMEHLAGFALMAGLAAGRTPSADPLANTLAGREVVALLGMHVLLKLFV